MNPDDELDRLYGLPLGEFIAARNELAKKLRADGDRETADRVKQLAKPSLTAWAVNQLHFRAKADLDALTEAGEEARKAHLADATAHQSATKARRQAVSRLLAIADDILRESGQSLSRIHRQRISRTLEALASHGREGVVPMPGRLSQDVEPPGFDALASLAAALEQTPPVRAARPQTASAETLAAETSAHSPPRWKRGAEIAERPRDHAAERQLAKALEAVAKIEEKLAGLDSEDREARTRLTEAECIEEEAAAASAAAERQAEQAREHARTAREATTTARLQTEAAAASRKRAAAELEAARQVVSRLSGQKLVP